MLNTIMVVPADCNSACLKNSVILESLHSCCKPFEFIKDHA